MERTNENSKPLVTLSMKIDPQAKNIIMLKAQRLGMTLSEYSSAILTSDAIADQDDDYKQQTIRHRLLYSELFAEANILREYKNKVENLLNTMFLECKGEKFKLKDSTTIVINSPIDLLRYIIDQIETSKK